MRDYHRVPPVLASDARLVQVFLNLLVNAAHAIPEGDANSNAIRVSVRSETSDRVTVAVTDSGRGMPLAVRQRLFTPFFTTKPEGVGTGLGLSICQRILSGLGGDIEVDSTEGVGTTVSVTLPATTESVPDEARTTPSPQAAGRARILVVDDEAIVQRAIKRILGKEHDVMTVSDGHEAIELIGRGPAFDVIFCDLMMPEMSGMALHAALAKRAPESAARMVFLTGGAFSEEARSFLAEVPNVKMEKPFEVRHLLDVVAERMHRLQE